MAGWTLKSRRQLDRIREAGRVVAECLRVVGEMAVPGATTRQMDAAVEAHIRRRGGVPAFKGYELTGKPPYPASICASRNDYVVHGIPDDVPLQEGDIISIDVGVKKDGLFGDAAWTFPVGKVGPEAERLLALGRQALDVGIAAARPSGYLSDVSRAIQTLVESAGCSVVREFVGHGIGLSMHEEPQVPNYVTTKDLIPGMGFVLKPGLVLAIEPMVNAGGYEVISNNSKWPVRTKDGSLSVHFEHTVAIVERGTEIMTLP